MLRRGQGNKGITEEQRIKKKYENGSSSAEFSSDFTYIKLPNSVIVKGKVVPVLN
jgi:hypothetical protein